MMRLKFVVVGLLIFSAVTSWGADWKIFDAFRAGSAGQTTLDDLPEDLQDLAAFPDLVAQIEQLYANLIALHVLAEKTGLKIPKDEMLWRELLDKKVIRQWRARLALTVVVAGGTKTGKSTTFNHLAGGVISEVSHVSAATKQSVVTVPSSLYDMDLLSLLFPDLELVAHTSKEAAAEETGDHHRLIVKPMKNIPDDMMYIDVPDIDSTLEQNWEKAYRVARSSDVIIAMISPEKHGDAASINFFKRVAADSNKPIVVVINKVQQDQIENSEWVEWLQVFCDKTGIKPEQAYIVPYGKSEASAGRQPFYKVAGDLQNVQKASLTIDTNSPSSLRDELRKLNLARLKAQAQVGALMQALEGGKDGFGGITKYLSKISDRATVYRKAQTIITTDNQERTRSWPSPPVGVVLGTVNNWWDQNHRYGITKAVVGVMDLVSIAWSGVDKRRLKLDANLGNYEVMQQAQIDKVVGDSLDELGPLLVDSGPYLSDASRSLLAPEARTKLIVELKEAFLKERDAMKCFRSAADQVLPSWEAERPFLMGALKAADVAGNVVIRPLITIGTSLAAIWGTAGGAPLAKSAQYAAQHLGESLLTGGASGVAAGRLSGMGTEQAARAGAQYVFNEITTVYAASHIAWINAYLQKKYLAPILREIANGAALDREKSFTEAVTCAERLGRWGKWAKARMKN